MSERYPPENQARSLWPYDRLPISDRAHWMPPLPARQGPPGRSPDERLQDRMHRHPARPSSHQTG
jgi:hypothetical protein